jgi:hypothetical protein
VAAGIITREILCDRSGCFELVWPILVIESRKITFSHSYYGDVASRSATVILPALSDSLFTKYLTGQYWMN